MVVWQAESVAGNIPTGSEPQKVGEWRVGVVRLGREDGVDGGIGMVDVCGVLGNELGQVVLVGRHVAEPGHDVKG